MKKKIFVTGLLLLSLSFLFAQDMDIRAWQFHVMKPDYVKSVIDRAKDYDINTVSFSHMMIGETSILYDGDGISLRGEELRSLAKYAKGKDLNVWIWVHELDNVPGHFLENGKVQMDKRGFWKWLENRYDKLFVDFPEFDGIILTFHETQSAIPQQNN